MRYLQRMFSAFLLFYFTFFQINSYAAPVEATPIGRVVWVEGSFKANLPGKLPRNLEKSSVIYLHDTLVTNSKSNAEVVFTDNTLITYRPNTNFYIDQYQYQQKGEKGGVGKMIMNLIKGGFRTITGLITQDNPSNYQVNTPVATIGVRGSDYDAAIEKDQLYLGRNQGKPCVVGKKGSGSELCLDENTLYAEVKDAFSNPEPLKARPSIFDKPLKMVPASIKSCGGDFM